MESAPIFDGDALRGARERAGLSQSELARRLGLADGNRISRWERGTAVPRAPRVADLARTLSVSAEELLRAPAGDPSLRWLRYAAGLSIPEVAALVDSPVSTVRNWETLGLKAPNEETVRALAAALSTSSGRVRTALRVPRQ